MMDNAGVRASPTILDDARFDDRGLVPVIAQEESTGAVLMLAWMDKEALSRTLKEGRVTYFSRSRADYWRKGDTSGHTQHAVSAALDCDGDAILLRVHQEGPACHTGRTSCFGSERPNG